MGGYPIFGRRLRHTPITQVSAAPFMEGVGARRGPGIPSVTTATEEGPVVCSEAPLARPPVCPSGGGVWWVPGASATRPIQLIL